MTNDIANSIAFEVGEASICFCRGTIQTKGSGYQIPPRANYVQQSSPRNGFSPPKLAKLQTLRLIHKSRIPDAPPLSSNTFIVKKQTIDFYWLVDWLVVSTPLKNMKVSWHDILNIWKNKKCSKHFQTTNQFRFGGFGGLSNQPLLWQFKAWAEIHQVKLPSLNIVTGRKMNMVHIKRKLDEIVVFISARKCGLPKKTCAVTSEHTSKVSCLNFFQKKCCWLASTMNS